eukprot:TRINITY_DN7479_c0_g1_i3.p1 TRINITY_DN7479_c0_g1~~TRINITY_DN7479_c0_g1_i3.p1  ORF type:complete len:466 (+),score=86.40 TRINITY_DN7479_c0_g1_i3:35-1399(+)
MAGKISNKLANWILDWALATKQHHISQSLLCGLEVQPSPTTTARLNLESACMIVLRQDVVCYIAAVKLLRAAHKAIAIDPTDTAIIDKLRNIDLLFIKAILWLKTQILLLAYKEDSSRPRFIAHMNALFGDQADEFALPVYQQLDERQQAYRRRFLVAVMQQNIEALTPLPQDKLEAAIKGYAAAAHVALGDPYLLKDQVQALMIHYQKRTASNIHEYPSACSIPVTKAARTFLGLKATAELKVVDQGQWYEELVIRTAPRPSRSGSRRASTSPTKRRTPRSNGHPTPTARTDPANGGKSTPRRSKESPSPGQGRAVRKVSSSTGKKRTMLKRSSSQRGNGDRDDNDDDTGDASHHHLGQQHNTGLKQSPQPRCSAKRSLTAPLNARTAQFTGRRVASAPSQSQGHSTGRRSGRKHAKTADNDDDNDDNLADNVDKDDEEPQPRDEFEFSTQAF